MNIYPVLDLKGGLAVRAVAGERQNYKPLVSRLAGSARPLEVARGFRRHLGLERIYLADLDAIAGSEPAWQIYRGLADDGFELLVDSGVRAPADALALREAGIEEVVAALETLPDPHALGKVIGELGPERVVFSLDLKGGRPLGDPLTWPSRVEAIVELASSNGVIRLLLLDLAAVGSAAGPAHLDLCRRLRVAFPDLRLLTGGGVRDLEDLRALGELGADAVLVGSAFHDGKLTRNELERLSTGE